MLTLKGLALSACVAAAMLAAAGAADARPAKMCPMIYRPVCAVTRWHHQMKTFGNRCQAQAAGARVLYNGRCRRR